MKTYTYKSHYGWASSTDIFKGEETEGVTVTTMKRFGGKTSTTVSKIKRLSETAFQVLGLISSTPHVGKATEKNVRKWHEEILKTL